MNYLDEELAQIKEYIQYGDYQNKDVSEVNVAWHLDHTLKSINRISKALIASDPKSYVWKPNAARTYILTIGTIPRGKGKSPKSVVPPENIRTEDLLSQLELSRQIASKIEPLEPNAYFYHPYFGLLNKKNSKKFIRIHTKHHLKIIRDIIGDQRSK